MTTSDKAYSPKRESGRRAGHRRRGFAPRAAVLLAGSVRATPFLGAIRRSVLDLPMRVDSTLFDVWCSELAGLARGLGLEALSLRVLLDSLARRPSVPTMPDRLQLRVERDPGEFRGTAGVLSDLARDYDDADRILVGAAAQPPVATFVEEALDLIADPSDVVVHARPDGTPTGLMLIRCGVLREIPEVGFVDLKEQALPEIAERHDVRVVRRPGTAVHSVRTMADYLEALRGLHLELGEPDVAATRPYREDWRSTFSIVEEGARVGSDAVLHDSVVLRGGVVDAGATVVRSVVAPGGRVTRRRRVVERMIEGGSAERGSEGGRE